VWAIFFRQKSTLCFARVFRSKTFPPGSRRIRSQLNLPGKKHLRRGAQKKRPLKRAGVKPDGARLYIQFLAGGTHTVVNRPIEHKAKFPTLELSRLQKNPGVNN
jgi:hypothetical protein